MILGRDLHADSRHCIVLALISTVIGADILVYFSSVVEKPSGQHDEDVGMASSPKMLLPCMCCRH